MPIVVILCPIFFDQSCSTYSTELCQTPSKFSSIPFVFHAKLNRNSLSSCLQTSLQRFAAGSTGLVVEVIRPPDLEETHSRLDSSHPVERRHLDGTQFDDTTRGAPPDLHAHSTSSTTSSIPSYSQQIEPILTSSTYLQHNLLSPSAHSSTTFFLRSHTHEVETSGALEACWSDSARFGVMDSFHMVFPLSGGC